MHIREVMNKLWEEREIKSDRINLTINMKDT